MVCTFIFLKKFVFNMKIIIYYWFLVLVGGKILLPKWNLAGKNGYLAGKNGYLAEKNGNLAEKNGNPAEKNGYRVEKSCYFPSFYMTSTRKLHKITNFEKYWLFWEKWTYTLCLWYENTSYMFFQVFVIQSL